MIFNKYCLLLFFCLFSLVLFGCGSAAPPLTEKEKNVRIATGNQPTTLELVNTHNAVGTRTFSSELEARDYAVSIDADVAQLIFAESQNKSHYLYTYRFWKNK